MKSKGLTLIVFLVFMVVFYSCQNQTQTPGEKEFPVISGEYLGQTPPGQQAELFAPGIISSGMADRDIAISPDLKEIYYSVLEKPHYSIVFMRKEGDAWTRQEIAPFSGQYDDCEPQFSPDGKRLYFCSNRPLDGVGEPKDYDIWFVERSGNTWSEPQNPGSPINSEKNEFYPSMTNEGTIYFTSHTMSLYRSRWKNGSYSTPEKLSDKVNSGRGEYNSFISPDESYLIFTSHGWDKGVGRGDLFICYRKNDDSWSKAVNLGTGVNSVVADMCPTVSPEGKYLFFSSMRTIEKFDPNPVKSFDELQTNSQKPQNGRMDIYWVDASIIEQSRPEDFK